MSTMYNSYFYYTLYSRPVVSLARLLSYMLADYWLLWRLGAQCMISNYIATCVSVRLRLCRFFKEMYNKTGKTIIRFGFCDIRNNQGLRKCYQHRPSARLIDDTFLDLDYPGYITKTESNNCLLFSRDVRRALLSFRNKSRQC